MVFSFEDLPCFLESGDSITSFRAQSITRESYLCVHQANLMARNELLVCLSRVRTREHLFFSDTPNAYYPVQKYPHTTYLVTPRMYTYTVYELVFGEYSYFGLVQIRGDSSSGAVIRSAIRSNALRMNGGTVPSSKDLRAYTASHGFGVDHDPPMQTFELCTFNAPNRMSADNELEDQLQSIEPGVCLNLTSLLVKIWNKVGVHRQLNLQVVEPPRLLKPKAAGGGLSGVATEPLIWMYKYPPAPPGKKPTHWLVKFKIKNPDKKGKSVVINSQKMPLVWYTDPAKIANFCVKLRTKMIPNFRKAVALHYKLIPSDEFDAMHGDRSRSEYALRVFCDAWSDAWGFEEGYPDRMSDEQFYFDRRNSDMIDPSDSDVEDSDGVIQPPRERGSAIPAYVPPVPRLLPPHYLSPAERLDALEVLEEQELANDNNPSLSGNETRYSMLLNIGREPVVRASATAARVAFAERAQSTNIAARAFAREMSRTAHDIT